MYEVIAVFILAVIFLVARYLLGTDFRLILSGAFIATAVVVMILIPSSWSEGTHASTVVSILTIVSAGAIAFSLPAGRQDQN